MPSRCGWLWPVLLLCILSSQQLMAQELRFQNYSVAEGLPSSEVYHAIQDRAGFMWFSTDRGISRFDGYTFTNFTEGDGLPDNTVFELVEDSSGRLWTRTMSGRLACVAGDSIVQHPASEAIAALLLESYRPQNLPVSLIVNDDGTVWIGTRSSDGFLEVEPDGALHLHDLFPDRASATQVLEYEPGRYLPACFYNTYANRAPQPGQNELLVAYADGDTVSFPYLDPRKVMSVRVLGMPDGSLLVACGAELLHIKGRELLSHRCLNQRVIALTLDVDGTVWLAKFNSGVEHYSIRDGALRLLERHLEGLSVSHVAQDVEGGLWFTTLDHGVYYLPARGVRHVQTALSESKPGAIYADTAGGCWVTYDSGTIDYITPELAAHQVQQLPGALTTFYAAENRPLLVAGNGLYAWQQNGFKRKLTQAAVKSVLACDSNTYWVGGIGGILKIRDWVIEYHWHDHLPTLPLEDIALGPNNGVYIATRNGLWHFDGADLSPPPEGEPLLHQRINALATDAQQRLWMATLGGGLLVLEGTTIHQIGVQQGLAGSVCNSLFMEEDTLWVGTNSGISRLVIPQNMANLQAALNLTTVHGLASNEVVDVQTRSTNLWVATAEGVTVWDKASIKSNAVGAIIQLTAVKVNEQAVELKPALQLTHQQNVVEFQFVGMSFRQAGNVPYRYRLEGIDSSWIYTRTPSVRYPALPPGNYRFVVAAANVDGVWSAQAATMQVHIAAPYWATWRFRGAVALLVALLFWIGLRQRIKRIRQHHTATQKMNNLERQALQAQMNPHFTFNALNAVQSYITGNQPAQAQRFLSRFARLIRLVLESSRSSTILLSNEIRTLESYLELEQLRIQPTFEYLVEIAPDVEPELIEIPPMLIQPFVENALVHGIAGVKTGGQIVVRFSLKSNHVLCEVEDNGVGRRAAANSGTTQHKSMAMAITTERLSLLSQSMRQKLALRIIDLEDQTNQATGTRVELEIPLQEQQTEQ